MQAIAARSGIKGELESCQKKIKSSQQENDELKGVIVECKEERDRYGRKHDEMFASVSNLNSRIEELEQHKLHLLNKLKKYGDKGGLEYIIKTQKLEGVRGKEFQDRVKVEDYKPEEMRKERDAEFARKQAAEPHDTATEGDGTTTQQMLETGELRAGTADPVVKTEVNKEWNG